VASFRGEIKSSVFTELQSHEFHEQENCPVETLRTLCQLQECNKNYGTILATCSSDLSFQILTPYKLCSVFSYSAET